MILADTNILLRSLHLQHPHHDVAKNALKLLRLRNETLCVAPQNLVEFWAVATRPLNENGLGMTGRELPVKSLSYGSFFAFCPTRLRFWRDGKTS